MVTFRERIGKNDNLAGYDVLGADGAIVAQFDLDADDRLYIYPQGSMHLLGTASETSGEFDIPITAVVLEPIA